MVRRVLWADLSIWACIFSILVHRCIHTALASWAATFKQAPMIAVDVDKIRSSTFVLGGLSDWSLNSLSSIRAKVGELGASVMYFNAISGDDGRREAIDGYEWITSTSIMKYYEDVCDSCALLYGSLYTWSEGAVILPFLHCLWHVLDFTEHLLYY